MTDPEEKAPYPSGQVIRYTVQADIASTTTYYWRIRAKDTLGSDEWGDWADPPFSFHTDQTVTASTFAAAATG